ncbi:MAG: PEP/pyruvate-binding domain-containing protein [Saprospiraceae bacterium]
MSAIKYVYSFGGGKADGNESMKNLLGGKGANLAEMAGHPNLQLPVPPGFTITTEVCTYYYENDKTYPESLRKEVMDALTQVENLIGRKYGDNNNPLLCLDPIPQLNKIDRYITKLMTKQSKD